MIGDIKKSARATSCEDVAALQGQWEQVALEVDGISNPQDEFSASGTLSRFDGNRFMVHAANGTLLLEGAFSLDASTNPKSVDWIDATGPDKGKRLPAIYRLDGDHFVFVAGNEGAARPSEFRTSPGQTMRSFRRRR